MASMVKVYRDYDDKVLYDEEFFNYKSNHQSSNKNTDESKYENEFSPKFVPPQCSNVREVRSLAQNDEYKECDGANVNIQYEDGVNIHNSTDEDEIAQLCAQNGYYHSRKYSKINPDGAFQCHKCSQTFSYSIYYQYHIENSRCSGKRYNRCYYNMNVDKNSDDNNNVKKEQVVEKKRDKEMTPTSSYEVKEYNDLIVCKPYKCSMCTSRFSTAHNLKVHLRTHTNEKPYQCTVCSARFKSSGSLTIHKRIHTGEKPYKCSICSAGFAQMTNLDRHIRTHTKERPYKCPVCPSGFISSSDLKRHIRIHTNEKPYKCTLCTASFRTSGNLKIHLRTHTNEKPYVCSLCSKSFATSSNFKTHMRRHEEENDGTPIICVNV